MSFKSKKKKIPDLSLPPCRYSIGTERQSRDREKVKIQRPFIGTEGQCRDRVSVGKERLCRDRKIMQCRRDSKDNETVYRLDTV